jgi:hypothetical protein
MISSPSVGDVDADGQLEIIEGCNTGLVYGWNLDGTPAAGFPLSQPTYTVYSSPLLEDLDLDGHLEIVVGCNDTWIYAWDCGPGTYNPNLLPWPKWRHDNRNTGCIPAMIVVPTLNVAMTPINPPIVIPANGGQFQFDATVQRTGGPQLPFFVWARDRYPDGTYTGNLLGPVQINPPAGVTVTRQRTQVVPATWPAGVHYYIGYANATVSYPATDADSFSWTMLSTMDGGPMIWETANYGEPFPGEENFILQLSSFILCEAKPNPFNPSTAISFELRAASCTSLKVYDTSGRLAATLMYGWRQAGKHEATFDGSNLASGVYLYHLRAGSNQATGKLVLTK